ncbi:methionine adenosyltransferase [Streptomyces sp. H10-C2]|uniref:methionine adenosyltransferase n=1 Tax=unclassified Streptomyces TaxID=2593676 RepID=UPI0024B9343E|nr:MULTISPECIES: methionine adenosyltransferase [unclassified Streptomyces]MDJ0344195.1 methionine adenosyltransferase [Streptomyces sp. PH10-H1]MDJ0373625.1 methionine adenosyltransferase [Streptomyces sp. H10-C2]MDJ0383733.1 methionine adenosyltransferase [Streptomyces sp. G-G2]
MSTATRGLSGLRTPLPHELAVEVVERKGVGHPDTLADGIAELASIRYSRYCLETAGAVLHHNLDKVAVLGGRAAFTDTGGVYDRPLRVIFGGRISTSFAGRPLPVREILEQAAVDHLRTVLPGFDRVHLEIRHESTDSSKFPHWFAPRSLEDLPERPRAFSNDTAYLVGSAPRTPAETLALLAEAWFRRHAWAGSDIKALVVRRGEMWTVTVCVPALAGHLSTSAEFDDAVTASARQLSAELEQRLPGRVEVVCNTRGSRTGPLSGQYFTLSGSAIDYGEDGLVGRGNARTGVISGAHLAGNEATFGKNPAYHVGKVGGWLADTAADMVAAEFGPCRIGLLWRNGAPYDQPASIEVTTGKEAAAAEAEKLVRAALARTDWLDDLLSGRYLPRITPVEQLLADLEMMAG